LLRNEINSDAMNGTRSNLNFEGMRGLLKFALPLCVILSLVGCSHQAQLRPEDAYREARAKFERGELVQALEDSDKGYRLYARDQVKWAWRFRVLKAEVLVWQGKSKDSLELLVEDPPSAITDDESAVRRKVIQSVDYYYLQEFERAEKSIHEAEQVAKVRQPQLLGEVASVKGRFATVRRDYVGGERLFLEALQVARAQNQKFLEVNALGNLGWNAMLQQHYDNAIDRFTASLAIARTLHNEPQIVRVLGNLGWCYYQLGDYEKSSETYDESAKLAEKLGLLNDQQLRLNSIGLIKYQLSDFKGASASYQRVLEITRRLNNRSATAIALNNLSLVALETGDLGLADQYNRESLKLQLEIGDSAAALYPTLNQARIATGRNQYLEANESLSKVIQNSGDDVSLRWEAESNLAKLYVAEGKTPLADSQYRKALSTIDTARAGLVKEEHRLSFLTTATRFYNDYIDFLVSHGRAREALAVAEHSRARTLAEGLKVPVSQLSGAAFHPEQNARKLNSVVLSYWLKPDRSYLWVVTPSKVVLYPIAGQDEIDATVQEYRKALLGPRPDTASAPGQKLYELLVAPAAKLLPASAANSPCPTSAAVSRRGHHEPLGSPTSACGSNAPRIIVIADGSLLSLNFETLLVPTPQPHYWIEDATIANASSIALLGASSSQLKLVSASTSSPKLLLIGNPVYTGTEFPQLSQAKLEIERVESYFSPDTRLVIDGATAKPTAYAGTKPAQYAFIHFVAHGTASRVSPLDSSIVLSKDGDAYKLYARDIMAQPLRAELVTISACYGAGNRAYSGEGLVGLSWAFLRAGAHNVIAALWEVNDASTPQLMDNLYRNIQKGEDPARALRDAKLVMLHSENVYRRPFYWGAFQLYVGS
jgi:CHAT domain-containing protein